MDNVIFLIVGGISLFLLGLNTMKSSMNYLSKDKLKKIISKIAGTPLRGLLTGIISTMVIQSSSGITAIVIGLISVNFMTLAQGFAIVIGANIGTCVTAFLFVFNIGEYSLIIITIGYFFSSAFKKERVKVIGNLILGLGLIFFGLDLTSMGCDIISTNPYFASLILNFSDNPIYSLLSSTFISTLLSSSSATIGMIEQFYNSSLISLKATIPLILGANIGTTIASFLYSIDSSKTAKQLIYLNILFNIIGALIFLLLLGPLSELLYNLEINYFGANSKITVAIGHTIFNIISALAIFFFINKICNFIENKSEHKKKEMSHTKIIV